MVDNFKRSISFTIPGTHKAPDVRVDAYERDGSLVFTVNVLSTAKMTADIRGLFFDFNPLAKVTGLTASGAWVSGFATDSVIDLGQGANMLGRADPFAVGLAFGSQGIARDDLQSVNFVLSNPAAVLTLDDIANVEFGVRLGSVGAPGKGRADSAKLTVLAPAAPDAIGDDYAIFEDGQESLTAPADTARGVLLQVLDNDTDADGDRLTVTAIDGPQHGTVQIVDGDDADDQPGDVLLYTPNTDYAGPDSFIYAISDNNGGTDFARVNIDLVAVADRPAITVTPRAGELVNQVIVDVTAVSTDDDGSEVITRIDLAGLPTSVQVDRLADVAMPSGSLSSSFLLTLPLGTDSDFDLQVIATSREASNADTETSTYLQRIVMGHSSHELDRSFQADAQNFWQAGGVTDPKVAGFIGADLPNLNTPTGGLFTVSPAGNLRAGIEYQASFNGGSVSATLPWDINVTTHYNKTVGALHFSTFAAPLAEATFQTVGPDGSIQLKAVFDGSLSASGHLDFGEWEPTLFSTGNFPFNVYSVLLDRNADDPAATIVLPKGGSVSFAWPELNVNSGAGTTVGQVSASGQSNNIVQAELDLVEYALDVANKNYDLSFDVSLKDPVTGSKVADADVTIVKATLNAGINLIQNFSLQAGHLQGSLELENGDNLEFTFGQDILLFDAFRYDSNGDGRIDYTLSLDPTATFRNDTDLGLNFGYDVDVFKVRGWYDYGLDDGRLDVGPLFGSETSVPVGLVGVFDASLALDFNAQTTDLYA